jgi:hypothetical protein
MNQKELILLGFIDTSYQEEHIFFTEFTLKNENFEIQISGIENVEIKLENGFWNQVPNCKTIEDLKQLIKLFTNN